MTNSMSDNLSITERAARVLLSLALIMVTITENGILGTFAIVPLLAIYPGITGVVGYDPLTTLLGRVLRHRTSGQIASPSAHAV